MLIALSTSHAAPQPVELTRTGFQIEVRIGGEAFATYHFDPSIAKPYFFPLRSAHGTIVTRDPSGVLVHLAKDLAA